MDKQTHTPYNWLRQISPQLLQINDIPLLGNSLPEFPWQQFTETLVSAFQLETLEIRPSPSQLRTAETLSEGIFGNIICYKISLSTDAGEIYWIMTQHDIAVLIAFLLLHNNEPLHSLEPQVFHGFYTGIILEALSKLSTCDFDASLTPQVLGACNLPNQAALTFDIDIQLPQIKVLGRILIPDITRKLWKEKFSQSSFDSLLQSQRSQEILIPVNLEVGHIHMRLNEWKKIAVGDFIFLDDCSLQPDDLNKGRLQMTAFGLTFFRAKIKDGEVKVLEHPLTEQLEIPMGKDHDEDYHESEFDEDFEETDFDEDEDFENSDFDEDEDESYYDDDDEDDDHHDEDDDEDEDTQAQSDKHHVAEQQQHDEEKESSTAPALKAGGSKDKISKVKDVNLNICVEVGRIQMSLQKLLELQPGNLIDINVRPEDGVSLVTNGTCIARGELLKIGETLGIRVLEIA